MIYENGIGFFEEIVAILSKLTVIMNCLFLFWFRGIYAHQIIDLMAFMKNIYPRIETYTNEIIKNTTIHIIRRFGVEKEEFMNMSQEAKESMMYKQALQFLVLIVVMEHFLFIFKYVVEEYIPDVVKWVERSLISIQFEKEKITLEQRELLNSETISDLRAKNLA